MGLQKLTLSLLENLRDNQLIYQPLKEIYEFLKAANRSIRFSSDASIGLGKDPDPTSCLDLYDFSLKGLTLPYSMQTQRDAIPNPQAGLLLYNRETRTPSFFSEANHDKSFGHAWINLGYKDADVNEIGNGAVETILLTLTIPPIYLIRDGEFITLEMAAIFANNANTKQVKIYFDGNVLFDTGLVVFTNQTMHVSLTILRTALDTIQISLRGQIADSTTKVVAVQIYIEQGGIAAVVADPLLVELSGTSGVPTNDDVMGRFMILRG